MSGKRKHSSAEESSGEFEIKLSGLTRVTDENGKVYYFQPSGTYGHNTSKRIVGSKLTPKKVGIVFEVPSWDEGETVEKNGGKHKRKTRKRIYRKKRRY